MVINRESPGDSLLKNVKDHEVSIIKEAIENVKQKTKKLNYNPELLYLFVNKKINTRFFGATRTNLFNPDPGSVITEELSIDDRFDFHLVAQKVTQGTATPTHYIVGYDSSKMPQEDLMEFTYHQCYNYYNWQGAVKVPATLQCANKLSKLAG